MPMSCTVKGSFAPIFQSWSVDKSFSPKRTETLYFNKNWMENDGLDAMTY